MNTDNHLTVIADSIDTFEKLLVEQSTQRGCQVVYIHTNVESLTRYAAELFIAQAQRAITKNGRFSVALSGGSTPHSLYAYLAQPDTSRSIHWDRVHLFWGDERCVPPDHADSNFRMIAITLLTHIPIPARNIHRIQGELPPAKAAAQYEQELHGFFGTTPCFDLVLLGLGEDGHTASLFPGSPVLSEESRWVMEVEHTTPPAPLVPRVTLTLPVFNAAQSVVFLVVGTRKAARLAQVLYSPMLPDALPAQAIRPVQGGLLWLVDQSTAVYLKRE